MVVRAFLFDAYGTLFDVDSAIARLANRFASPAIASAVSLQWRQRQLEYSWMRTIMGEHVGFDQVTADALDHALAVHHIADPALRADLLAAYDRLDAYPEVASVLARLQAAGYATGVLSNGTKAMLETVVASAGLPQPLHLISVEEVGRFKTASEVYDLGVVRMSAVVGAALTPHEIAFQSSNAWDAAAAARLGFRVHWINRAGAPREYGWAGHVTELRDLGPLASG